MFRFIQTGGNKKRTKEKEEDKRVGPVEERKKRGRCEERQSRICRLYFPYQHREGLDPVQVPVTFCIPSLPDFLINYGTLTQRALTMETEAVRSREESVYKTKRFHCLPRRLTREFLKNKRPT